MIYIRSIYLKLKILILILKNIQFKNAPSHEGTVKDHKQIQE